MNKTNLKAMVMAAGLGSRLEPITLTVPKPLVPVANVPIMDIILSNLAKAGINDVISNTYYLADRIIERYSKNRLGINFSYIVEHKLSGTAGGVKKCQHFFDEGKDFVVISGDVLTNADIAKGVDIHQKSGAVATIGVKEIDKNLVSNFGVIVRDKKGYITEFQEKPPIEKAKSNLINTGIYIFNYEIFNYIPSDCFCDFAKDVFPKLLKEGKINTFDVTQYWNDIGTIEQYKQSIKDVFCGKCKISQSLNIVETNLGNYISGKSKIPANIRFIGNNVIGDNCKLGEYIMLENCIVYDGAEIKTGTELSDCIVLPNHNCSKSIKKIDEVQYVTV